MTENTVGTFRLEGLVQGPQGHDADFAARLRQWVRRAAEAGLHLDLEFDGGRFSVLADPKPVSVASLPKPPRECITEALEALTGLFPPGQPCALFSTLRSVEYRTGQEVQTLYVTTPEGVDSRQRIVEAATVEPPKPLTRRQKIRLAAKSAVVLAALVGISTLFVPYGWLWDRFVQGIVPPDVSKVAVDLGPLKPYLTVKDKKAKGTEAAIITLARTDAMPRTLEALEELARREDGSLWGRMAVEALARGYVRCETFDRDGKLLGVTMHRIASLRDADDVDLVVPLTPGTPVTRIVIAP